MSKSTEMSLLYFQGSEIVDPEPCPRGAPSKTNQGPMPLDQLLTTEIDDTMSKT